MKHNLFAGVVLSLVAALIYSLQTAMVKGFADQLPPLPIIIFIQSVVAFMLILPFILKRGRKKATQSLSTKKIKLHMQRSIYSLSISYLLFYAVTFIPLVNGVLLANTAPLIIPFLGYLFLSQKINHRLWIPILIGFSGVAIVLRPDSSLFQPASLLAIGAAVSLSLSMLAVRKLADTEATQTTLFYFFLFSSLISGLISIPFWTPIDARMFLIMATIGGLYFSTQYLSTIALKYANAQLVGSLFYSNIIYATLISFFAWNTLPTAITFIGMALIITGGIFCIRVEHTTHLRKLSFRQVAPDYVQES